MPIFKCSSCGCVENTAVSGYWTRLYRLPKEQPAPAVCSACDPAIGKWHGIFPQQPAAEFNYMLGADGFLYGPDETPSHTQIVGPA